MSSGRYWVAYSRAAAHPADKRTNKNDWPPACLARGPIAVGGRRSHGDLRGTLERFEQGQEQRPDLGSDVAQRRPDLAGEVTD